MHKQPITVMVDGINITASHFAAMKREDAIAAMKADNIGEGKLPADFFGKAYDASVKAVADDKKKQEDKKAPVATTIAAGPEPTIEIPGKLHP